MNSTIRQFTVLFVALLLFSNCAKRGTPSGGPKDSIPPVIIRSNPENFTTNFTGDEIRIYFDEYIKLDKLQQNLIISPPLKYQPLITPLNTSKTLKIKILDTLKENTTYSFNFGKSIVDNNEANPFEYYKYIISTGSYIDSLTISGKINDALLSAPDKPTTILLYEWTENFKDSLIYSEKPTYITTTRDSTYNFELTNLKEGAYMMLALQEESNNYTFQPSKDKIGYVDKVISTPNDSSYTISIFSEIPDYKIARPSHVGKHKIVFGYTGNADSLQISPILNVPEGFTSKINRDPVKDSLNYWFKPEIDIEQTDTLYFTAKNKQEIDTLPVRMRELFMDSLKVTRLGSSNLIPRDSLKLQLNTPIVSFNPEKVTVLDKDSTKLEVATFIDETYSVASVVFDKKDDQQYTITILPEAITDFFDQKNDTLVYGVKTLELSDYGELGMTLGNVKEYPIIVELVDSKNKVVRSKYLTQEETIYFDYVNPDSYYFRIIVDANKNKKWDTGSFLNKVQPEKVIYFPSIINIRPNFYINETFILD